jgi:hypothetical protein
LPKLDVVLFFPIFGLLVDNLNIRPLKYEQGDQNRQIDQDANSALIIQVTPASIPKNDVKYTGEH